MIELRAKIRKWGNSFGVVVPQRAVSDIDVKEGDDIVILLKKEEKDNVLREMFGALKGWKIDAQKIKDELRKEEREAEKRKWG
ncbi:hypothetical protein HYT23_00710 [Candidatus Pacearchaeota archaeon]|nr:hypothetical protein [Candidatus Pacearchaeota archaeon]